LELLVDQWIANDGELYQADQRLMKELNGFLDEIAKIGNQQQAFNELRLGLKGIKDSYISIQNQFAELQVLSAKL
jgi:hypothetical protein